MKEGSIRDKSSFWTEMNSSSMFQYLHLAGCAMDDEWFKQKYILTDSYLQQSA